MLNINELQPLCFFIHVIVIKHFMVNTIATKVTVEINSRCIFFSSLQAEAEQKPEQNLPTDLSKMSLDFHTCICIMQHFFWISYII